MPGGERVTIGYFHGGVVAEVGGWFQVDRDDARRGLVHASWPARA